MALYNFRTTWNAPGSNPADRVIWSWGLDVTGLDSAKMVTIAGIVEVVALANHGTAPIVNMIQTGYSMSFHEIFPAAGGEALHVREAELTVAGNASAAPSEVQLVVSRLITTPRGLAPKGRLYVGPQGSVGAIRPAAAVCEAHAEWALALHEGLAAVDADPVLLHNAGTSGVTASPIVGYRVDNLWDTQRRRGLEDATFVAEELVT